MYISEIIAAIKITHLSKKNVNVTLLPFQRNVLVYVHI